MVDNLELILPFLEFDSKEDFYYLQILQRKKENPQLGSNSRVIKNYYITSQDYLIKRYEEIKMTCVQHNARAMLRLNRRNFEKVAFKALQNIANSMANREHSFIRKSYDRACGNGNASPEDKKTWILDIDGPMVELSLDHYQPEGPGKILATIPSKNGFHLISKPFDLRQFKTDFPDIEVHKDNPTNLFIP